MPTGTTTKVYLRPDDPNQQVEAPVLGHQSPTAAYPSSYSHEGQDAIRHNAVPLTSEHSSHYSRGIHQSGNELTSFNPLDRTVLHESPPFFPHVGQSSTLGPLEGRRKRSCSIDTDLESPIRRPHWSPGDERSILYKTTDAPYGSASFSPSTSAPTSSTVERSPLAKTFPTPSPAPPGLQINRYGLRIRQQPVSARAGPPGRDRRTVDPPCILQLTITDFDPHSAADMNDLQATPLFIVQCTLRPAEPPARQEGDDASYFRELNNASSLLLGGSAVNAFFSPKDPDPSGMAAHPSTQMWGEPAQPRAEGKGKGKENTPPAAFFIFSDLSVRKAGRYRLEFKLLKMDAMLSGERVGIPVQAQITSDVFECYNAKEFPSIQPSTQLVRGLLEQGAPRPLTLKKGVQGRRNRGTMDEEDD